MDAQAKELAQTLVKHQEEVALILKSIEQAGNAQATKVEEHARQADLMQKSILEHFTSKMTET